MDNNMKKELCIRTVEELKSLYVKKLRGAIFHSDRGSQYTSEAFKNALQKAGLCQSLRGTGHCFDNARMESFFATLKKETTARHHFGIKQPFFRLSEKTDLFLGFIQFFLRFPNRLQDQRLQELQARLQQASF
jgi:transposase InsO family protein